MCILITLPESILGVYNFACVDASIPIQYKCIDTYELYLYLIIYYIEILRHAYMRIYVCACVYVYIHMPANACYYTWLYVCLLCVLILCMLILWYFFTYGCLVRDDLIKKFKQNIIGEISKFWNYSQRIFWTSRLIQNSLGESGVLVM